MKSFKTPHLLLLLFSFVLLVATLSSCKGSSVVPPATTDTTKTITVKEIVRDTVFEIQKDSASLKALLECQNGKVVVSKPLKSLKGTHILTPKVSIKNNILKVDCEAEAYKLFAKWKDTYINEHSESITKIPYPVEKPLSWWQKTQIILGRLFLGLIIVFTAIGVIKYFKYI